MGKIENGEHSKMVKLFKMTPRIIGLDGIALSCGECPIFDNGVLVREPDGLMFDPQTRRIYNIEYKSSNSLHNRTKAKHQLRDVEKYLGMIFPTWDIKNLYVSENFEVEEIR
jgi:hypothetical protein